MSDTRKKRLSMLDGLTTTAEAPLPSPAPATGMMPGNRALRAARNAVDGHHIWELDPRDVIDDRVTDRLDHDDVADLRMSIEDHGQTVPILVRRHESEPDRYKLVYGRRRLEAIKTSDNVKKVRAIVAQMDEETALTAQISENRGRKDLTFIERALFAHELIEAGVGKQQKVGEILAVSKSAISMAVAVVDAIGPDLIRAIGPADGVGRPRWEKVASQMATTSISSAKLIDAAERAYVMTETGPDADIAGPDALTPSVAAFEAVAFLLDEEELARSQPKPKPKAPVRKVLGKPVHGAAGETIARVARTKSRLQIEVNDAGFAEWLEGQTGPMLEELHARYKTQAED